ncbi:MAG: glycosyltransferase [Deltaproteobacteria bacterium]|nr:glycosyltransferase [Deltaproteobacteria bacterium]
MPKLAGIAHVAFVLPNLAGGGAERSLLTVANGLIERGHRVDIILFGARIHYPAEVPRKARLFLVDHRLDDRTKKSARAKEVLNNSARISMAQLSVTSKSRDWLRIMDALRWDPLCLPGPRLVRQARAVAAYLSHQQPDCVVPSLPRAKIAALLAGQLLGTHPPIVPTIRNVLQARRRSHKRCYRHLFGRASHFICVSQGVADSLVEQVGVFATKVSVIHNPVVTPDLDARMTQPANHPWMDDGGVPVILSAGRLSSQKDYPTLVKAFARVAETRPCRLIILGEGGRRTSLERLVARLGLTGRVSLPGWADNPFAFMARAALFVLSSRFEGLPGVLVQALACGCPCVSTDCPAGPAEVLQDGRLGQLVPVGDPVRLAEAMVSALERPVHRQTLRAGVAAFSAENAISAYEGLIRSVIRKYGESGSALEHA